MISFLAHMNMMTGEKMLYNKSSLFKRRRPFHFNLEEDFVCGWWNYGYVGEETFSSDKLPYEAISTDFLISS